ncbi:HpcH/HpaI aldolase family protein [Halomonas huangheensis]|uniref:HpcH/HpaI aldolase/citrate lyase domain-containing protein n=1 Tax=Halomonas huangheensis TaxID=1178482 RepID=W1N5W3_9GAMM|nr:aldolase/citrate lyase family protein [Halomonas huangheensis]ALM54330.1 4-hydroxy-2-oxovalerate aldolase [Halomonas huangheensis]ERL50889.1 hypothetical protein BJB45_20030 [Halomonas huangheensis]
MNVLSDFKSRLQRREPLLGAFIKTPHPIIIEVMGASGLDFLILDMEHAPFDRGTLDAAMIAGRAVQCPLLVRVPVGSPENLLAVLDSGAAGVIVPHVLSAPQAEELAKVMYYGPGGRGFAGTTRAASYGRRPFAEHLRDTAQETCLICQIEDVEGAQEYQQIAAVDGVDALFIGRADLAVSSGFASFFAEEIVGQVEQILGTEQAATGLYCAPGEDLQPLMAAGASFMVVGSDHTLMAQGVDALAERFQAAIDQAATQGSSSLPASIK